MAGKSANRFSQLLLALAFSLAAAYYASLVYAPHREPSEQPQWQQALRITPANSGPHGYFRYRFQLEDTPRKAILTLAAPDQFELFVNGSSVGESAYVSLDATGVYDIAPYLLPGDNVIAVAVLRETYPGPASLRAEGYLESQDGRRVALASGAQWRAATTEQWQREGTLTWYEREFDDWAWHPVHLASDDARPYAPLPIAPAVLEAMQAGGWMWLPEPAARDGVFRQEWRIEDSPIGQAWLGVSTSAAYSLTINGRLVGEAPPSGEFLNTYAVADFLRPGLNHIEVSVHSDVPGGRLALTGAVQAGQQSYALVSGPAWQAVAGEAGANARWSPPVMLGAVEPLHHKVGRLEGGPASASSRVRVELPSPVIRVVEARPAADALAVLAGFLPWLGLAIILNLVGVVIFVALARRSGWGVQLAVQAYLLPQAVVLLPLLALLLARYDVRLDPATLVSPFWLMLGTVVLLGWWIAMLIEARLRSGGLTGEHP